MTLQGAASSESTKEAALGYGSMPEYTYAQFTPHGLKSCQLIVRSRYTTCCLVSGVLQSLHGPRYVPWWQQKGHTLQNFWPKGNLDETVWSPNHNSSQKNSTRKMTREIM